MLGRPFHLWEAVLRADDLPAAVIAAARSGDVDAVSTIYRRYAPTVLAFYRSRVLDEHLAEDLTAEAFLAMVQALPAYRGGPEAFAGWLFTLARRDLLDHVRRTQRRPETLLDDVGALADLRGHVPDIADDVVAADEGAPVRAALARLTAEQREVLVLRVVAGLTAAEIADVTGRTVGSVKALQHRALDSLGRMLGRPAEPYPRTASRRL